MRHLLWVLFLGLLTTAAAQSQAESKTSTSTVIHLITAPFNPVQSRRAQEERLEALENLASDVITEPKPTPAEGTAEDPSHKTTQTILEAVESVVASLTPQLPGAEPAPESEQPDGTREVEASVPVPSEAEEEKPAETNEPALTEASEAEEVPTPTAPTVEASETPEEEVPLTKKELKAVEKYNAVVDQVLNVLSRKMKEVGPIPINVDEQSLMVLDEEEEEPEPEPDTNPVAGANTRKGLKNKRKGNKKNRRNNKNKNKDRKNMNNSADKNNNNNNSEEKENKKNKNKNNNNSGENKNNRRKNKNKRNNKRNNRRQPKSFVDDGEMEEEEVEQIEEGRRKNSQNVHGNNRQNKRKGGNKRKNNKNNKNKKGKRNGGNKKNNKGRSDLEGKQETGPTVPSQLELDATNVRMHGLTKLVRDGDVTVELNRKKDSVKANILIGPLKINLKDKARALTKAEVTTYLSAVATFKVKSVRLRSKISVKDIAVMELLPEEVTVTRADLTLNTEVITTAQKEIVGAVDTGRVGRILKEALESIFHEDNTVEKLEDHPALKS